MIPEQSLSGELFFAILAFKVVSVSHLALAIVILFEFLEHTDRIGVMDVLIMFGKSVRI